MHKVTKILGMIASTAILLLILLPVVLSMVISLPSVQNRLLDYATSYATEYLGAEVSVGNIDVTMRGGVELIDLMVKDLDADTLLYVSRLESSISRYSFLNQNLRLGHSSIKGATLNLRAREVEGGGAEMNIRQITRLLANKNGESKFEMAVESLVIDDMTLRIEQLEPKSPSYGVDIRDIELNDLRGAMLELNINGPAIHGYIERMYALEKSGFEMRNVAGELYVTEGSLAMSKMNLESRWSSLSIDELLLANSSWGEYRNFEHTALLSIGITDGVLSSDDLAYFSPSMLNWGIVLRDLEVNVLGEIDNLRVGIENMSYGDSTKIVADLSISGLPDVKNANLELDLKGLVTTASDIDQIKWSFSGNGFTESAMTIIERLGEITARGGAVGSISNLAVDGGVSSEQGSVTANLLVDRGDSGLGLKGDVDVDNLGVGRIFGIKDLGDVTLGASVDALLMGVDTRAKVSSDIESIGWRNTSFDALDLSFEICDRGVEDVVFYSRSPKLNFDFKGYAKGVIDRDVNSKFDLDLEVNDLDFKAFGFAKQDSLSHMRVDMSFVGEGLSVEECYGDVEVASGAYIYNLDTLDFGRATLSVDSREGSRSVDLKSDFADASFSSASRVAHITDYVKSLMVEYLPALYNHPEQFDHTLAEFASDSTERIGVVDSLSYSYLNATTKDISPIVEALSTGVEFGTGSTMQFRFDPSAREFDLRVQSPYFERGTTFAVDIDIASSNRGDSIVLDSRIKELFVGTSFIESTTMVASARDNRVRLESSFVNPADSSATNIGAIVSLNNSVSKGREYGVHLLPSTISRRNVMWRLDAREILIGRQGVDVDGFKVESRDQLMQIDGRASQSKMDTLRMSMKNFDLSIFSTLIAQLGYNIEGRTNGVALISSTLDAASLDARIELDSVSVNTLPAPPMLMQAQWDSKLNQARLSLLDRVSRDTLIRGFYIPSEVRYYASLNVDSLQMAMLDPPLGGVISNTEGLADLNLTLQGVRRVAHLNGEITTHDVETTVTYTNTRYRLPSGKIAVNDNLLSCNNVILEDMDGNSGTFSLGVDLQHLSNIAYSVRVGLDKMMVLNTTESDNDQFYGKLFATGALSMVGDKSGVKMDIVARSDENSHFYMPLANKANISTADFITFVQPTTIDTTDMTLRRREYLERVNRSRGTGAMDINMALDVQPNTELQLVIDPTVGDIIRARGEGRLDLRIEPKSNIFDIYGDYTISEGNYLFTLRNIVNKRFVIDPGSSIQWTGQPMDPILDINAIYKLKASLQPLFADESSRAVPVDCVINLSDRLAQPNVAFAINLPSSDPEQQAMLSNLLNDQESISRQFFYLMLANSFIPETSAGGTSDLGVSTTAATGFELLTNQLSNWLSSSNYNVVIRYRPESELTGDEVDFGFSKGLINNRLLVELEGNYIIDNKQAISEDASNFMGEAYVTWLIDRAGALRLRGFTQTIDRFDENQGLQETGIGVYYRENFDNFRDLRDRVRNRFRADPERKERRKAKREDKLESEESINN